MRRLRFAGLVSLALALAPAIALAADPPTLELKTGDHVVYLGNTFAERDQNYGYLETLLTTRFPDADFTFRNLGWSGDTVWGDARARFGTRADGFQHLKDHILALEPTVILVAYGMNESFAGEAGLKGFEAGLTTLLDTLAETKAKIVLFSPIPHEDLGPPLPDPAKHNADLRVYRDHMAKVAEDRGVSFVDLMDLLRWSELPQGPWWLTDDGIHLKPRGYAYLDKWLAAMLGALQGERLLEVQGDRVAASRGWTISDFERSADLVKFVALADSLSPPPFPPAKGNTPKHAMFEGGGGIFLRVLGLPRGRYAVREDGRIIDKAESDGTAMSFQIGRGPEIEQVETLRATINAKNKLYFYRWRPQNETYLFGFRKHEQGNNAVEIPQFDPLVAAKEAEIHRLKKPVPHTYEFIREGTGR